ncbi:MAG: glycosyltransferase family 4 protein [Phycisphaerales bacterium]|nr:glycosyltransferase family 4 protein [Phycisphaerales bacterium]
MDVRVPHLESAPVDVALCVDAAALARLRATLRHLCVGLVDHPVRLRLLSSTPQIEALSLGPVQAMLHPRIRWPVAGRRIARIVELLSEEPPDVVHAVSADSYDLAAGLAEALNAELALDVSSWDDCRRVAALRGRAEPHVIAFSAPLADALRTRAYVPEDRIDLVRPGIMSEPDAVEFAPEGRVPTLLTVMPFQRVNRLELLIRALAMLRDRGVAFAAFLMGEGPREESLRALVRAKNLHACVTFANITIGAGELMQGADVLVMPAPIEHVSIRILQAMAAGMAVVSVPSPVNDSLRDGETCFISQEDSATALAAVLERVLSDRAGARRIAEGGLRHVRQHHTVSGMAERTAATYVKLRSKQAAPPSGAA